MGSSDGAVDDLITPLERESDRSLIKRNLDSLFRNYKSQGLAFVGAVTGSLPAFVIFAILAIMITSISGAGAVGWKIIVLPYAAVVTLLTVSSADFLNQYSINWRGVDKAVSSDLRKGSEENRPLYELLILYIAGLAFISAISLSLSVTAWIIIAASIPSVGPYIAISLVAVVMFFERWLVNEKEMSITVVGMKIAKGLMKNLVYQSPKRRLALDSEGEFTKMLITGAVAGRVYI